MFTQRLTQRTALQHGTKSRSTSSLLSATNLSPQARSLTSSYSSPHPYQYQYQQQYRSVIQRNQNDQKLTRQTDISNHQPTRSNHPQTTRHPAMSDDNPPPKSSPHSSRPYQHSQQPIQQQTQRSLSSHPLDIHKLLYITQRLMTTINRAYTHSSTQATITHPTPLTRPMPSPATTNGNVLPRHQRGRSIHYQRLKHSKNAFNNNNRSHLPSKYQLGSPHPTQHQSFSYSTSSRHNPIIPQNHQSHPKIDQNGIFFPNFNPNLSKNYSHPLYTPRRYRSDRWNNPNEGVYTDGLPGMGENGSNSGGGQFNGMDKKNFTPQFQRPSGSTKTAERPELNKQDLYEKAVESPDPKLEDSRFMRYYGLQRNLYGHEDLKTTEAHQKADKWLWSEMVKKWPSLEGPGRFGSRYHKMLTRRFANKKRERRGEIAKYNRQMTAILHGALSIGTFISIMYDSDAGWRGLFLVATGVVLVGIVFPLFLILVLVTWLTHKWRTRRREAERLFLLSKYGEQNDDDDDESDSELGNIDDMSEEDLAKRLSKGKTTPQQRKERLKTFKTENNPSFWDDLLITIGLRKEKKEDPDSILGGILKHVDMDSENFEPKAFLAAKFPAFEWTQTGAPKLKSGLPPGGIFGKTNNGNTSSAGDGQDDEPLYKSDENAFKIGRQLSGFPNFDSEKLKKELLDAQMSQVKEIKKYGPKGMIDFMVARLQNEQDELRLDRDVITMNMERLLDLIEQNMTRYKSAVRLHRPGHVIQGYEQAIDAQKVDLTALRGELKVVDHRGWELKRRIEILQQSLHNAVYSNLNGIEHPVVNDLISSDLQQVLFGHMPSDLIDQKKLFELASLLAPIQNQFIKGKIDLDDADMILQKDFGYFFPSSHHFNDTLPQISALTQSNASRRNNYRIQHVLEPLVETGEQTQKLIQVSIDDFETEFQNKFQKFDSESDSHRIAYIRSEKERIAKETWDNSSITDKMKIQYNKLFNSDDYNKQFEPTDEELQRQKRLENEKFHLQALKYQKLREEALSDREDRQLRYETTMEQFDPATRRRLGAFGKDFVGQAANYEQQFSSQGDGKNKGKNLPPPSKYDVPIPKGYKVPVIPKSNSGIDDIMMNYNNSDDEIENILFLKDGSFVGGYDETLKKRKEQYNIDYLLEKERQETIQRSKEQQSEIISSVVQDPRLLHQLETDYIAFGNPIVTNREHQLHHHNQMVDGLSRVPIFRPDGYGTKEYTQKVKAITDSRPEFWNGSLFQDRGLDDIRPISSLHDTLPRTIAGLMGFKRKDSDYVQSSSGSDLRNGDFIDDSGFWDNNGDNWNGMGGLNNGDNKNDAKSSDGWGWGSSSSSNTPSQPQSSSSLGRTAKGNWLLGRNVGLHGATTYSQEDIKEASEVAMRTAIGKQDAVYSKFKGMVNASERSRQKLQWEEGRYGHNDGSGGDIGQNGQNNTQTGPGGGSNRKSHWGRTPPSKATPVDNSYLNIDTRLARPVSAIGPTQDQIKKEERTWAQKIQDKFNNNQNMTSNGQQNTSKYTINIKSNDQQSSQQQQQKQQNGKNLSKNQDPDGWSQITFPDTPSSTPEPVQKVSRRQARLDRLNAQIEAQNDPTIRQNIKKTQTNWSVEDFDDYNRVDNRNQMNIIKGLVAQERREETIKRWFGPGQNKNQNNNSSDKNNTTPVTTPPAAPDKTNPNDQQDSSIPATNNDSNDKTTRNRPANRHDDQEGKEFLEQLKKNRITGGGRGGIGSGW